jgi:hypothetical protein
VTKHLLPPVYTRSAADVAELTRTERSRDAVRVTRGAYLSRAVAPTAQYVVRAALEVLPQGSLASHRTAAVLLGAPVGFTRPLEFAVPPGSYRARRRGIKIYVRDLTPTDCTNLRGIPLTSGAQTWLDLATVMPADELVAVGDALTRTGHLEASALAERLRRASGTRGVLVARRLAPLLTPMAASRPESLVRYWLIDGGLPVPQVQVPVLDRRGRIVAHGDLGYPEWKVLVEYEGRHHAELGQFRRDVDRYSLMAADGWTVVRLGGTHLQRDLVIDRVGRTLRSRGARW